jgi:4-diphosphocytidyl-2-C-methyl-D-erythritol kinase
VDDSRTVDDRLTVDDRGLPSDRLPEHQDDNLVLRAARLLAEAANIRPSGHFQLVKRIPIQAGMGGGSSNAAATLRLANQAWNLDWPTERLLPLAAKLGSDVPFFLEATAAIGRGRGELLEPVPGLPKLHLVIAKPSAGLSTPEVFRRLAPRDASSSQRAKASQQQLGQLIRALRCGALSAAGTNMTNRLETAAENLAPWLSPLRALFARLGCVAHFMTGSGSAYVGLMRSAQHARRTAACISSVGISGMDMGRVFATSTY